MAFNQPRKSMNQFRPSASGCSNHDRKSHSNVNPQTKQSELQARKRTGRLIKFTDYAKFDIFDRKAYIDKHSFIWKSEDGVWKFALIIGVIRKKIIVELGNGDIRNVKGNDLFPFNEKLIGQKWRR